MGVRLIDDLSVTFYPYHFVHTIFSNTILSVYHFVHTILSVPFCPLPFCPRTAMIGRVILVLRYGALIDYGVLRRIMYIAVAES